MADARSPWRPPADVPPERLFRALLRRPRPWAPIAYRYPGAEHVALHVRALTPYEVACAMDVDADGLPPEVAADRAMAAVVTAALWTPQGPAFADPSEAAGMPQREWARLMDAALRALYGVMPARAFCDAAQWAEWSKVLERGAKHASNWTEMLRAHSCCDIVIVGTGRVFVRRPDRYFGMPIADLTEGQQLAFNAAFDVAEELRQKSK